MENDWHAGAGQLPSRLRARQPTADHMYGCNGCHGAVVVQSMPALNAPASPLVYMRSENRVVRPVRSMFCR